MSLPPAPPPASGATATAPHGTPSPATPSPVPPRHGTTAHAATPHASLPPGRPLRGGLIIALLVLVADQLSKWWVLERLRLPEIGRVPVLDLGFAGVDFAMVWNRGITFGLLAGEAPWHRVLLAVLALAVVGFLLRWLARAESRLMLVALGAVIGGAIGNVIDRLRFGAVVDFVDTWAAGWHWYVFNVADAAIVLGVIALMGDALFRPKQASKEAA